MIRERGRKKLWSSVSVKPNQCLGPELGESKLRPSLLYYSLSSTGSLCLELLKLLIEYYRIV